MTVSFTNKSIDSIGVHACQHLVILSTTSFVSLDFFAPIDAYDKISSLIVLHLPKKPNLGIYCTNRAH
jgi:hypothetical protein